MNSSDAAIKMRKGQSTTSKNVSQSAKTRLEFPVSKVAHFLTKDNYVDHVSAVAPVYLTTVLEYLAAEVLELAGNEAKNGNKKSINPRHLKLAVRGDDELKQLLHDVTLPNAGVMPEVHHDLLQKSTGEPEN